MKRLNSSKSLLEAPCKKTYAAFIQLQNCFEAAYSYELLLNAKLFCGEGFRITFYNCGFLNDSRSIQKDVQN
jgi:hypothetical protein